MLDVCAQVSVGQRGGENTPLALSSRTISYEQFAQINNYAS